MRMFLRRLLFTRHMRAEVWQMLADLTGTGMELGRAMDLVGRAFETRSFVVKGIMADLRKSLASDRFKEVARRYSPESEALIFSKFGTVRDEELFLAASRIARVEEAIRKAIVSAIARPVFLALLVLALLYFLGNDFYPTLMLVAPIENWPQSWRMVAGIALWVAENPFWLVAYVAGIFALYRVVQNRYVGPFRKHLDRFPPFSLYRLSVGATFVFVVLENAAVGNAINSSLMRALSRDSSRYGQSRIMGIAKNISSMNFGAATIEAGHNFPDPELNAVLEAYCEQKDWVDNFRRYAEAWLSRLEDNVKAAVSVLNMILMIIASIFIAVVGRTIFGVITIIN